MTIQIRIAVNADAAQLAQLEQRFNADELGQSSSMLEGQCLNQTQLQQLIQQQWVVVAEDKQTIVGYVIAARWPFYQQQGLYRVIKQQLKQCQLHGQPLSEHNSCQYGPIWIEQRFRGQGLFQRLVEFLTQQVKASMPYVVAFIAEDNERSFAAHTSKGNMQVIDYISYQQRDYYLLARAC
ncbi:GNAT family N-acetyltransferase [Shewanella maritima]|uniref:GNAT family N-acetyltransferase n=1 Tax=Shewanella maritima TaxID=2520507 RepID=UPI0037356FD7